MYVIIHLERVKDPCSAAKIKKKPNGSTTVGVSLPCRVSLNWSRSVGGIVCKEGGHDDSVSCHSIFLNTLKAQSSIPNIPEVLLFHVVHMSDV